MSSTRLPGGGAIPSRFNASSQIHMMHNFSPARRQIGTLSHGPPYGAPSGFPLGSYDPSYNRGMGWGRARVGGPMDTSSQPLQGTVDASYQMGGPLNGRRQNLGFPTTIALGAGLTATVASAPQVIFRSDRTFIASGVAGSLVIDSILVGNKEQLLNGNPVPGSMFSELAVDAYTEYDTCEPAVSITLQVTNTSLAAVTFTPGMTGRSAY